jgi:cytochrome c
MNGVAARHPAVDPVLGRPVDLEQRINLCGTARQQTAPLPFESTELLALAAFVAPQIRRRNPCKSRPCAKGARTSRSRESSVKSITLGRGTT